MEISEFFCHSYFTWNQSWRICSLKNCILTLFEALKSDFNEFLHFVKADNDQKSKLKVSKNVQNCHFGTSRISKIDFTQNLSGRKMLKYPHCVHCNSKGPEKFIKLTWNWRLTRTWSLVWRSWSWYLWRRWRWWRTWCRWGFWRRRILIIWRGRVCIDFWRILRWF